MSMKPGVTTWPDASSSRLPPRPSPIAEITPSVTATSARCPGAPLPSSTVPPRITRSALICSSPSRESGHVTAVPELLTCVSGLGNAARMVGTVPGMMRAAVYKGDRRVEVEQYPVPDLGPEDVLLEVSHCGVCGSDIHFVLEGWGRPNSVGGHEYSGTIAAVGDAVTDWKVGDSVVGGPPVRWGGGRCCLAGRPSLCSGRSNVGEGDYQGAFADYMKVK